MLNEARAERDAVAKAGEDTLFAKYNRKEDFIAVYDNAIVDAIKGGAGSWAEAEAAARTALAEAKANAKAAVGEQVALQARQITYDNVFAHTKDEAKATKKADEIYAQIQSENAKFLSGEGVKIPGLDDSGHLGLAPAEFLEKIGAHESIVQGALARDPTAMAVAYILQNAWDWHNLRETLYNQVKTEERTLLEFQTFGATSHKTFADLQKASAEFGDGRRLAVFGSFGTDLVTFANRHVLMTAVREGRLNMSALMEAYGRGGEALVLGRIIPDMGKPGGPFSKELGDIDLALIKSKNERPLPGEEAVKLSPEAQGEIIETKFRGVIEDKFLDLHLNKEGKLERLTDFDYAGYENESLRGFDSSLRGRLVFENGVFVERQQSVIYGAGGAITRDFGQFFENLPQERQAGVSNVFNSEIFWRAGVPVAGAAVGRQALTFAHNFIVPRYIGYELNNRAGTANTMTNGGVFDFTMQSTANFYWIVLRPLPEGYSNFYGPAFDDRTLPKLPPEPGEAGSSTDSAAPAAQATNSNATPSPSGSPLTADPATALTGGVDSIPTGSASAALLASWNVLVKAALAEWSTLLGTTVNLNLAVQVASLGDGILGASVITAVGADGRPTAGVITIDASADGRGWYFDPTPLAGTAFVAALPSGAAGALAGSVAAGRYDLFSFVLHETGHLLGFTDRYSGFAAGVTTLSDGSKEFDFNGVQAALASDSEHLSPTIYPYALMNGYLAPGVRLAPSALEASVIRQAWYLAGQQSASGLGAPSFQNVGGQLGFVELAGAVQGALANPPVNIVNGSFSAVDPGGSPTGWSVFGNVLALGNNAVLTSVPGRLYTDLSQTFLLPAAASRLEFTLSSAQLLQLAGHPSDAFEMALLNATTSAPLFSRALSGTDALISLQANGQLYLAPQVGIKGQPGFTSGSVVDTSQPITFTIDLSTVAANTPLTVYFDLISLNGAGSRVNVSNVTLPLVVANNQAPVARPDSATTDSNAPVLINVLGNDTDADGTIDPTSLVIVGAPAHGKITLDAATGFLLYTPALYYSGTDSFSYRVRDDQGSLSNVATVTITIRQIPIAPAAVDDNYTVPQGSTLTSNVLGNDVSPNGLPITAVLATGLAHGALVLNADGSFTYTPDPVYSGLDAFSYRATDGTLTSGAATVRISVTRVPHAPVAVDDTATVAAGGTVLIPVTANDTNVDGDSLVPAIVTLPAVGTATVDSATGSIRYTAPTGFSGVVTLTYRDFNTTLQSAIATVTITVLPSWPADDRGGGRCLRHLVQGVPVSGNVLANDIPLSNLPMRSVLVQGPAHGTLVLNANGSFTYTPSASFIGIDGFTYYDTDGARNSANAHVTISVNPPNRPPVAVNDNYTLDQRTRLIGNVAANDHDADGDPIHVALVRGPVGGTLQLNSNGSFIYTPTGDFYGTDSFTYVVDDGKVVGNTATVTLTIRYVNRPPIATAGSYNVDPFAAFAANLTTFAVDPDGDPLTVRLVNGPSYGSLVLNPDGTFTYRGSPLNPGFDSFTYQVGDGQSFSAVQTITLNFTRRLGIGYYIRDFWGLSAPGEGDAVTDSLRIVPARPIIEPIWAARTPFSSGAVDGVYLVSLKTLTLPLQPDVSQAVSVSVLSIRAEATGDSLLPTLIGATLADGKLTFAFDSSLLPGAYDLVVRFTFADGSTLDQYLTVYFESE